MKRTDRKSHCPVNSALETVGDPWSLLVVRDIVFHGKHAFGEFLASEERITTSVLADRLETLVRTGILTKRRSAADRRKQSYSLTEKGLGLIPVLVELANWGVSYDPDVAANPFWVSKAQTDRAGLHRLIRDTVAAGGSVFRGENSVISQLERAATPASPTPSTGHRISSSEPRSSVTDLGIRRGLQGLGRGGEAVAGAAHRLQGPGTVT